MRIFILCTGRSGSKSFINACSHIENYSCGHETLSKIIGESRFDYPDNHIEADNRLSWFLGTLDQKFGNEAFYIHLTRNKSETINSFNNRWNNQGSIIKAYSQGILMQGHKTLNENEKHTLIENYYNTVTDNISFFLKNKDKKMTIDLKDIKTQFKTFFESINAEGDLEKALNSFDQAINTTRDSKVNLINRIKNKLKK